MCGVIRKETLISADRNMGGNTRALSMFCIDLKSMTPRNTLSPSVDAYQARRMTIKSDGSNSFDTQLCENEFQTDRNP